MLDHLAWQLVIAHTGQPPQGTRSGFPIFKTEAGYEQRSGSMILGVSECAKERIRAAQPYHLGGDAESALTWVVHELDTDKHRLIPVAVAHTSVGSVVDVYRRRRCQRNSAWQEHVREPLHDGAEVARVLIPAVDEFDFQTDLARGQRDVAAALRTVLAKYPLRSVDLS